MSGARITVETILLEFGDLTEQDLYRWIDNAWLRPEHMADGNAYRFHDIDLARIRLMLDLRDVLEVPEPAFPTVLSLLDQLYESRRRMRRLNAALGDLPEEHRAQLLRKLTE